MEVTVDGERGFDTASASLHDGRVQLPDAPGDDVRPC